MKTIGKIFAVVFAVMMIVPSFAAMSLSDNTEYTDGDDGSEYTVTFNGYSATIGYNVVKKETINKEVMPPLSSTHGGSFTSPLLGFTLYAKGFDVNGKIYGFDKSIPVSSDTTLNVVYYTYSVTNTQFYTVINNKEVILKEVKMNEPGFSIEYDESVPFAHCKLALVKEYTVDGITYDLTDWSKDSGSDNSLTRLKAVAVPRTSTVTWNVDGVSTVETYNVGSDITAPSLVKEGYTGTWDKAIPNVMPAEPLEFTASWGVNKYTVAWDNGSSIKTETYDFGANLVIPELSRTGHSGTWDKAIPETMPATNLEFTAIWTVNEYKITWTDGDTSDSETLKFGDTIVMRELSRTGYTGVWVGEMHSTMPAKDLVFESFWTVNSYDVAWNNDGVITTETYDFGANLVIPELSRTGYTGVWVGAIPETMPATNLEFTASWTVNSYDMIWNNNGSSTVVSYNYGDAISIPAVADRAGYTFGGWNTAIPATMPAENITITAIWTPIVYTISFSTHGSDVASIDAAYDSTVAAPETPTREGYTFMGWDRAFPMTVSGDMTATALWSLNYYEVIYIVDGETVNSRVYGYGSAINDYVYVKEGYTVSAWDTVVPATMPASNLIFMATSVVNTPIEPEVPVEPEEPEVPITPVEPEVPVEPETPVEPTAAQINSDVSDETVDAAATMNGTKVFVNVTDGVLENETVQFSVGTELAGKELEMYLYGENGFTQSQTATVDENGFVTITVSVSSEYVLVSDDSEDLQVVGGQMDFTYIAIIGAILVLAGVGAVMIRRRMPQDKTEE